MFDAADKVGNCVYVAQDTGGRKGTKEYASLKNHMELAVILLSAKDQECCMYELIREGEKCKIYLDLEWESSNESPTDAHRRVSNALKKFEMFIEVSLFLRACCSSTSLTAPPVPQREVLLSIPMTHAQ